MYFSFISILEITVACHTVFPVTVRIPSLVSVSAILLMLFPSRYSRKILRTSFASSGTMIRFPSSSLVYPRNLLWFTYTTPFSNCRTYPQCTFSLKFRLSSWAWLLRMVISISPPSPRVLIFSFSKYTAIFFAFNFRIWVRESTVFLAKRLMDFVITISIFPVMQLSIIAWKSFRLRVMVALFPSSA